MPAAVRNTTRRQVKALRLRLIGGDLQALASDALDGFRRRSRQGGVVPLRIGLEPRRDAGSAGGFAARAED